MEKKLFALKRGNSDTESKTLAFYAALERTIELKYFDRADQVPADHIPSGTIPWVTSILGTQPRPDYYPEFLSHLLYRKVWKEEKWPMRKGIFIKPYDVPKRFQARITTGTYKGKKRGPYWCSEIVSFVNEWRYYVIDSKVLFAGWYAGRDEDEEAPTFDESLIPSGWCGCIDMGILSTGEFALIEAGEPYSMGWYGSLKDGEVFSYFLEKGWEYLKDSFGTLI